MKRVRLSTTFTQQLDELLAQGEPKFGVAVVEQKKQLVRSTITQHLAHFPNTGRYEPEHNLFIWTVRRTPFVILYDFDETELRIHMIVHKAADRTAIEPGSVEW
jgi:plasmid stabilization system protein ParE